MKHSLVLGSASAARASILERAGIAFTQLAADIDEAALVEQDAKPRVQAQALATAKAHRVANRMIAQHQISAPAYIVAADSVFEFEGRAFGKPLRADVAAERWRAQRGKAGCLHTGHTLIVVLDGNKQRVLQETVSASVSFAHVSETEINDYVATGEPLNVAGGFTIEGRGATLVSGVEGDPNAVLGLSLRAVREMLQRVGVSLTSWWHQHG